VSGPSRPVYRDPEDSFLVASPVMAAALSDRGHLMQYVIARENQELFVFPLSAKREYEHLQSLVAEMEALRERARAGRREQRA
jgi:hypothetical protein